MSSTFAILAAGLSIGLCVGESDGRVAFSDMRAGDMIILQEPRIGWQETYYADALGVIRTPDFVLFEDPVEGSFSLSGRIFDPWIISEIDCELDDLRGAQAVTWCNRRELQLAHLRDGVAVESESIQWQSYFAPILLLGTPVVEMAEIPRSRDGEVPALLPGGCVEFRTNSTGCFHRSGYLLSICRLGDSSLRASLSATESARSLNCDFPISEAHATLLEASALDFVHGAADVWTSTSKLELRLRRFDGASWTALGLGQRSDVYASPLEALLHHMEFATAPPSIAYSSHIEERD